MSDDLCGCHRCIDARIAAMPADTRVDLLLRGPGFPGWRYACVICGNKRCPHHTDHTLACTDSNDVNQPGSDYRTVWRPPAP
jgi:hypothetical protein